MNPYDQLVKNRSLVAKTYAAMMLNATTFRMFKKNQSEKIRKFLIRRIGDDSRLSRCENWDDYTRSLAAIIRAYQREFRMSRTGRKPNFGQAAKVVNLYVKHLLMLPDYLVPYDRRRLEKHAHVPLDRQECLCYPRTSGPALPIFGLRVCRTRRSSLVVFSN
jgi:hypothetical protein